MKKDELKEKEEHKCVFDEILIKECRDNPDNPRKIITVSIDCSCEESKPILLVSFYDTELLSADNNFKGWFQSVVGYFIQNDFKLKDLR